MTCLGGLPAGLDVSGKGLAGTLPDDPLLWPALASLGLFTVAGNSLQVRPAALCALVLLLEPQTSFRSMLL